MSAWFAGPSVSPNVVHERAKHVLVVAAGPLGARRGLERVGQPVDREAAEVAAEQLEVGHQPLGQPDEVVDRRLADDSPVLLGAVGHGVELGELGRGAGQSWHGRISNLSTPIFCLVFLGVGHGDRRR